MTAAELRQIVTVEFLEYGLGAKLLSGLDVLLDFQGLGSNYALAEHTATELKSWLSLGEEIGYLEKDGIKKFLADGSAKAPLRNDVAEFLSAINPPIVVTSTGEKSHALFQAASQLFEQFTESRVDCFFRYLQDGSPNLFEPITYSHQSVFEALEPLDASLAIFSTLLPFYAPHVLAGFIRTTEVVAAFEHLFHLDDSPDEMKSVIRNIVQWRVPGGYYVRKRFDSVERAFLDLVQESFARNPGVLWHWKRADSANLLRASFKDLFERLEELPFPTQPLSDADFGAGQESEPRVRRSARDEDPEEEKFR